MKHALWLQLLARLMRDASPLRVIDTHAGAGLYDLQDEMARRSREAEAGVGRLLTDETTPQAFASLKAAVRVENPDGVLRFYPGSPLLTSGALRAGDHYVGCELRADDQAALQGLLNSRTGAGRIDARAILADGYGQLGGASKVDRSRRVYLIDPPFERGDEYAQVVKAVGRAIAVWPDATFAIWAPLKDLETFDALLRGLEGLRPAPLLVAESRLRPLLDPMKMNGSAMIFLGALDIEADAKAVCDWVVGSCGEPGGKAQVRKLGL